jgi:hypothetical protein
MQTLKDVKPEVPDDVRAESDVENRRAQTAPDVLPSTDVVPEDVLSERDREARAAQVVRPDDLPLEEEEE